MVIEMRTYKTRPGRRAEFLEAKAGENVLMPMLERYDVALVEAPKDISLR